MLGVSSAFSVQENIPELKCKDLNKKEIYNKSLNLKRGQAVVSEISFCQAAQHSNIIKHD